LKITLGTFKDQGEELATFLEPRVGAKPSVSGGALEVEDGSIRDGVKPRHVKTYIKRFMYMKGVKKNYRVFVAGKELTIQEIELGKKEEEEKEEKAEKGKEAAQEAPSKEEGSETKKEEPAAPKESEKAAPKKPRAKKKKTES
jgi:sRNA-binding protein